MTILNTSAIPDWRTRLLPDEICDAVIGIIECESAQCGETAAIELTARLLRNYPDFKAHEAKGFVVAVKEVIAMYPLSVAYRAMGPQGLPGKLQFVPKTADVKKALDDELARREQIKCNAKLHKIERENRAKQEEEEAKYNVSENEREARNVRIKDLIANFRNNIPLDPILSKVPKPKYTDRHGNEYKSDLDMDKLIASHDTAIAGAHRRKSAA